MVFAVLVVDVVMVVDVDVVVLVVEVVMVAEVEVIMLIKPFQPLQLFLTSTTSIDS
ncbi:MAG TPA: hypothetical protein VGM63_11530 [Mucilaginibacter sp.]